MSFPILRVTQNCIKYFKKTIACDHDFTVFTVDKIKAIWKLLNFQGDVMKKVIVAVFVLIFFVGGCSSLVLKPADFGWPVETVLKVDNNGMAVEKRYSFTFNTKDLFLAETKDSSAFIGKEIRVIRSNGGYYFMTGNNFKNVYVFRADDGSFTLANKIAVTDSTGMKSPAFNQRSPYIELLYDINKKVYLDKSGIKPEGSK